MALWRRVLAAAPDGVLVADVTGHGVRGVVRFGADPDDTHHGHVFSLYVHPDAQTLGLGRTLLHAAAGKLRAAGYGTATLWVFARNDAARGFYAAQGWTPDRRHPGREEAYGEPEVRLRRKLPAVTPAPARRRSPRQPRSSRRTHRWKWTCSLTKCVSRG